ncbi:hypothetical protein SEF58_03135 [Neomoorella humiferrea]|uniref:hypothetical protein n=1 Tax=Neomoorella humiferrea TaxID=676965 RepID=UPI003D8E25F0
MKKIKKMGMMIITIIGINNHQKLKPWPPIRNSSYLAFSGNKKNRKMMGMIMITGIMMINHHNNSCVIQVPSFSLCRDLF